MFTSRNIRPLTEFLRRSKELTARMEANHEPLALTINGTVKLVVMEAEAYEQMVERDRAHRLAELESALRQVENGETLPIAQVRERAKARYGVSD